MQNEVWVTGCGIISALGIGIKEHANALQKGVSGLTLRNLFEGAEPDPCVCGIVPELYISSDIDKTASCRADLLLDCAVKDAISSAGLLTEIHADMVAGTTLGNMHGGTMYYREMKRGQTPDVRLVKNFLPCGSARRVAAANNIYGNHQTVCSACASGSSAIGLAFRRISSGACSMAIAGGFDALSPFVAAGFNSLRLVSPTPCTPFGKGRAGLNPGEGAAMLVLEKPETATKRGITPLAVLAGYGEALEAYHYTLSDPAGSGPESAIRKALAIAGLLPEVVDHIHLHGTGTEANDRSEYTACFKIFGKKLSSVPACSTKSATGHTFGAAGAINAVFAVISLLNGTVPATLNTQTVDPEFENLNISGIPCSGLNLKTVVTTALGFGGESSAMVFKKAEYS
jgi:3-oxoacyl-[acyl-carrier-protein] synthase-1